jgi:uncharacterized membrane-anchored protein YitT (DUF2179 family)
MMSNSTPSSTFWQKLNQRFPNMDFSWKTLYDYLFILAGAVIQALAMRLFLIPGELVSGGISGAAQIINHYVTIPIGLMAFVGNVPIFVLGWRYLGGPRFAVRTAVSIVVFSFLTDALAWFIPAGVVTNDLVLNSLYGALLLGVGLGLVYRGQGTSGGSDILGRILNRKFGISISQSYLVVDSLVVLASGFAFNWQHALYGLVVIYVSGLAAEMASEGTIILRTAMIVTSAPEIVTKRILTELERGVTLLEGTGGYTGQSRPVIYCVVTRAEVAHLKSLVSSVDPKAFMVIGQAHEALGEGFTPL